MRAGILTDGVIAGAAGTTALNAVTYLDMTLRARPSSDTPERSAGRVADVTHLDLGSEPQASNRRAGLGPLLGYGIGLAAGAGFALLTRGRPMPLALAGGLLGGAVMTASGSSYAVFGVSDPRTWSRGDWLSDLIPHLAFGLVAAAAWNRLRSPHT